MSAPPKSLAQRLKDADDFDPVCGNAFWWDNYIAPHFGRRWRLALAGRVFMLKSVHDEMRHRDLLAKAHVAASAYPAIVVLCGPRSGSQRLALVPTEDELRTAAQRHSGTAAQRHVGAEGLPCPDSQHPGAATAWTTGASEQPRQALWPPPPRNAFELPCSRLAADHVVTG